MAVHLESVCVSNQVHSLAEVSTDIFSISIKLFLYSGTWPSYLSGLLSLGFVGAVGARILGYM